MENPLAVIRELNNRSLHHFLTYFWKIVSAHTFLDNWHLQYLSRELEEIAERVAKRQPRKHDLIINIPPGSTKTLLVSILFPVWCWTKWPWMRFITASYSGALSLESAETSRELIRSPEFQLIYPDIDIKPDKDTKSNYKVVRKVFDSRPGYAPRMVSGGYRFSTSVGGTLMGFHADMLIVDDPLNPQQAASETELMIANRWMEQTLPTRKTDKDITPTILIMQRLNQDDPTGHLLAKEKENIRHICIPGEIRNYREQLNPPELSKYYDRTGLFDPIRLPWKVLRDLEADLGQYGYAGQIGQNPTPPGGGLFKVDHFQMMSPAEMPTPSHFVSTVRYWDKAGTADAGAYTAGVKIARLDNNRWVILDVKRGRWGTEQREAIIRQTAEADGAQTIVWVEQEPGSGGKESSEGTIRNLAGFAVYAERPTGDKAFRADPYSVQVNNGNMSILVADWNRAFIEEHRFFPFGKFKDQVDAAAGAFNHLVNKKVACRLI